jgi:hypothetical protein
MLMNTRMATTGLSYPFRRLLLAAALVGLLVPMLHAQEIRIKVLNGHNGKAIAKECLNIWVGTFDGPHLVAATNRDGVVVLQISDDKLVASAGCQGWSAEAAWPTGSEGILVTGDYYVACQEYAKVVPNPARPDFVVEIPPLYPIRRILEPGASSSNTCGKFRAKPMPGELIFFMRPMSFWEKMRL